MSLIILKYPIVKRFIKTFLGSLENLALDHSKFEL